MINFLHIGMPKTLTSVLQKSFYPSLKSIYYLGIGSNRLIDYIDDDINFTFETLFLYANSFYFNTKIRIAKKSIEKHYKKALKLNKKAFGASNEWLSFNFSPAMIDNETKFKRLSECFPENTKIIIVIRNQKSLLRSLYNEYVKVGLPFNYEDFIKYVYNFKDRNFYYQLCYDKQLLLLTKYFNRENIYILPLESYRENKKLIKNNQKNIMLIEKICSILNCEYPEKLSLPKVNPSLNETHLYYKRKLNKKYRHDFGNLLFEHSNIHRSRKYFEREKSFKINDYFKDVKIKRLLLYRAKIMAKNSSKKINYKIDKKLKRKLYDDYIKSNKRVEKHYSLKLPDAYYDM